jgi:hypothetical protein
VYAAAAIYYLRMIRLLFITICEPIEQEGRGYQVLKLSVLLFELIIVAIFFYSSYTAFSSHRHEEHPCTQLWVYTEPVLEGPCIVFKHPTGHELQKKEDSREYCKRFYGKVPHPDE